MDKAAVEIAAGLHDFEPKIFHISVPVGTAFECFDDIVHALRKSARHAKAEVVGELLVARL